MKYYIASFGCQMNDNDSALIAAGLEQYGHQEEAQLSQADIIIVNTCCVRQNAENKAWGLINSLKPLKKANPGLIIAVCGCMIQKQSDQAILRKQLPHVDIICGTFSNLNIPGIIEQADFHHNKLIDISEKPREECGYNIGSKALGSYKAAVTIIHGCNNYCSYCIVPYVRGREKSRQPQDILAEIIALRDNGCKEIMLLGQNVNSYGHDLDHGSSSFGQLLQQVDAIDGIERIRYMTSHPRDFDHELVDIIASCKHICHHFHLPLQSGSDRILKLMNRGYSSAYYLDLLDYIRAKCKDAVITTDILVGFPGESDNDFADCLSMISKCQFDAAYTFIYSPRQGTPAATMENQIDESVKKQRLQMLMELQNEISFKLNQQMIGKNYPILYEGPSKNNPALAQGRSDGNKIVIFEPDAILNIGDIIDITITDAKTWNLYGKIVKK